MKNLLTIFVTLFLAAMATTATSTTDDVDSQTLIPTFGGDKIGLTYLHDGYGTSLGGLQYDLLPIGGERLTLGTMLVGDMFGTGEASEWYAGALLGYDLFGEPNWTVTAYTGYKGVDVSSPISEWTFTRDQPFVFGLGVSFKLGN